VKTDKKLGWGSASSFVVANMIGTGVFTSLGFQLLSINSPVSILILWALGGVIALCGALVYSELGSSMPRSGGEYHYLSVIYGPAVGFLSGWVSMIIGFAAPVALACMAFGRYVCAIFPCVNPVLLSIVALTVITLLHSFSARFGSRLQNVLTILKVVIILVFIVAGFCLGGNVLDSQSVISEWSIKDIVSPGFAVALIWVYYSFSGWNASAYIANDIDNPSKNIPRSLLASTLFVTVIYLLINYIFLRTTPISEMRGAVEVGFTCANNIFGAKIGSFMGIAIAGLLLSSISSMVFVGPRVTSTMGEDHKIFAFLARKNKKGSPITATWFQYLLSMVMILTDSFEKVTEYTGILLSMFGLLTVFGIFIRRHHNRGKDAPPYKVFAYPIPPVIFCILMLWTICYMIYRDIYNTYIAGTQSFIWTTALSIATVAVGYLIYLLEQKFYYEK